MSRTRSAQRRGGVAAVALLMVVAAAIGFGRGTGNGGAAAADAGSADASPAMTPYTQTIPGTQVEYEMVPIPGGVFTMGSPAIEPGRQDDEGPQVQIQIEPFWMGRYEVTWGEYRVFMEMVEIARQDWRRGVRPDLGEDLGDVDAVSAPTPLYDVTFVYSRGGSDRHPAVNMTQYGAKQYTNWLSKLTGHFYRLPTEAEWEYAARAGTETAFSFGGDLEALNEHAWNFDNADDRAHPVGSKRPNPWGLYDMHGNVCEWVLDGYRPDHFAELAAKPQPVHWSDAIQWPTQLYPRVVRGGSWLDVPVDCRSARRLKSDPEWNDMDPDIPPSVWWFADDRPLSVGFRIVRPLREPDEQEKLRYWEADVEELREAIEIRTSDVGQFRMQVGPETAERLRQHLEQ